MKSSEAQLRGRGLPSGQDRARFAGLPEEKLPRLLRSPEAAERTIAAERLGAAGKDGYIPLLCEALKSEKKLYTKLAVCDALAGYGAAAVPCLVPLLGTIGSNQHREPAIADLDKKCYPLPRDIVSRILMRIGPPALPGMIDIIEGSDRKKISEAVDVIGHITWNFRDFSAEQALTALHERSRGDELIFWKTIRAFQSFESERVRRLLENVLQNSGNAVFVREAQRSLARIAGRSAI
ncbi:hypothetical protein [Breznakiella homolactica]|uniref:HEAT repeat domain-containing protein n=1 Tax=Breznakiella homolactica TaxID=2798577 RepID=A0A7T7XPR0_9SPIR|nr:hypothetical protein [Breznakiella homolactica]QQO10209.1 hypothetical protein JFL75_04615 [Breznakiella homolactica]